MIGIGASELPPPKASCLSDRHRRLGLLRAKKKHSLLVAVMEKADPKDKSFTDSLYMQLRQIGAQTAQLNHENRDGCRPDANLQPRSNQKRHMQVIRIHDFSKSKDNRLQQNQGSSFQLDSLDKSDEYIDKDTGRQIPNVQQQSKQLTLRINNFSSGTINDRSRSACGQFSTSKSRTSTEDCTRFSVDDQAAFSDERTLKHLIWKKKEQANRNQNLNKSISQTSGPRVSSSRPLSSCEMQKKIVMIGLILCPPFQIPLDEAVHKPLKKPVPQFTRKMAIGALVKSFDHLRENSGPEMPSMIISRLASSSKRPDSKPIRLSRTLDENLQRSRLKSRSRIQLTSGIPVVQQRESIERKSSFDLGHRWESKAEESSLIEHMLNNYNA